MPSEFHDRRLGSTNKQVCFRGVGERDCRKDETDCDGEHGRFDSAVCFEETSEETSGKWRLVGTAQVRVESGQSVENPLDALHNHLHAMPR